MENIIIESTKTPDVTIIMSIYNTPIAKLTQALSSVVGQTYKSISVVIIDDYSDEENRKDIWNLCSNIKNMFSNFHPDMPFIADFSSEENKGHSYCRNIGLKTAHDIFKSEYVFFIDSDDMITSDTIAELIKPFDDSSIDISIGNYTRSENLFLNMNISKRLIEKNDISYFNPIDALYILTYPYMIPEFFKTASDQIKKCAIPFCATWNKIFRTSLFYKFGSDELEIEFPEGYTRDDNFTAHKLLYKARKIAFNEKIFYYYRRGGSLADSNLYSNDNLCIAHKERIHFLDLKNVDFQIDKYDFQNKAMMAMILLNEKIVYAWTLIKTLENDAIKGLTRKYLFNELKILLHDNIDLLILIRPQFVGYIIEFIEREENKDDN